MFDKSKSLSEASHSSPIACSPFWRIESPTARAISSDMTCETVVIGAGITGLAVAHSLSSQQSVILLESGEIGLGSSGWNAGLLSMDTTVDLSTLEEKFGGEQALELTSVLGEVINDARSLFQMTSGKGDFWQSGRALYVAAKPGHCQKLFDEDYSRKRNGLESEFFSADLLFTNYRGFSAALVLNGEQAIHPVAFLYSLAAKIEHNGGMVYQNSRVQSWEHLSEKFLVRIENGLTVRASNLVLCTGLSGTNFGDMEFLNRLAIPVTGHVLVTRPSQEFEKFSRETEIIALWDSLQLYHYVRYFPDGRVLIGGEESPGLIPARELSVSDKSIQKLFNWGTQHHVLQLPPIEHAWRATLAVPLDGLPLVKSRQMSRGMLVSAVTDGLPSGLLLGRFIANSIVRGEPILSALLNGVAKPGLGARLFRRMHSNATLNVIASGAAFSGLRLYDSLF